MFEKCGRTTDDDGRRWTPTDADGRRTPDHGYTISSPCEPEGSGELITAEQHFNRKEIGQHIVDLCQIHRDSDDS